MSAKYPLTRRDFDTATRVLQRLIEFRDAEDGRPNGAAGIHNDRSAHLRKSTQTLTLAADFWAAPDPQPKQSPQTRNRQSNRPRSGKRQ